MSDEAALRALAELTGIDSEYVDIWGTHHPTSDRTRKALLNAMRHRHRASAAIAASVARPRLGQWPAAGAGGQRRRRAVQHRALRRRTPRARAPRLDADAGKRTGPARRAASRRSRANRAPRHPQSPYHAYRFHRGGRRSRSAITASHSKDRGRNAAMRLIVAPSHCYRPAALDGTGRVWGLALQLYAVRSQRNWGIGDFTDLKTALDIGAHSGAGVVGVNPLHALFPSNPAHCSPYSPSSRLFLNPMYLDVEAITGFHDEHASARARSERRVSGAAACAARGRADRLRRRGRSQDRGAGAALRALRARAPTLAARSTRASCAGSAKAVKRWSASVPITRCTNIFSRRTRALWGWPVWPQEYRDPASPAGHGFRACESIARGFLRVAAMAHASGSSQAGRRARLGSRSGRRACIRISRSASIEPARKRGRSRISTRAE